MKKIFFVALAIIGSSATTFAQSKAPKEVETAFNAKFPKAIKVKWDKENATEYEANFINNGVEYSANFSIDGKWLETESPETFENLPVNIQTAFSNSHKGVKIKAVAKIETLNSGIQYEIEVKKGLKTVEYLYNSEGKLIK
jgi:hypothetical protein